MEERHFPCDACGLCCRKIGGVPGFEAFDSGDGTCMYLGMDNQCTIYKTRPLQCRINEGYEVFFSSFMSWEEYVLKNISVCETLKCEVSEGAG